MKAYTIKQSLAIIAFLSLISSAMQAQRFNWSASAGYPAVANSYLGAVDLVTDNLGNVYTFDFANLDQVCQGDTIELISQGTNLFVYKFNPEGELIWGKSYGTTSGIVTPLNIEMGSDGKLYVLAHTNSNNILSENSSLILSGPTNFILCLESDGEPSWAQSTGFSCPACLMLEVANDRIYFQSGQSRIESIQFDQSPDTNYTFYFDPGTAIFTLPILGSAHFSNGDILLAGLQRGNSSFIEGDTLFQVDNPFLYSNITYLRLTENLEPVWAVTYGSLHDPETHFIPVAIDENDQIYTAWEVLDTISIAGTTVVGDFNNWAATVLAMTPEGTPIWLRELESNDATQLNFLYADEEGNKVWLTGISSSPLTIGDSIINPNVNGSPVLAAINSAGEFSRQVTLNELPTGSKGRCIGKAASGQLYLGGILTNGSSYSINCIDYPGDKGLFLASFLDVPQNPPTPVITSVGTSLTASPHFQGNIQWFFEGEEIMGANNQTLEISEEGNYSAVYSYDFGCDGEASSEVVFVSTRISHKNSTQLSIYPNPGNEYVYLKGMDKSAAFVLINSSGALVMQGVLHKEGLINTNELNAGMYCLIIPENGLSAKLSIVK